MKDEINIDLNFLKKNLALKNEKSNMISSRITELSLTKLNIEKELNKKIEEYDKLNKEIITTERFMEDLECFNTTEIFIEDLC